MAQEDWGTLDPDAQGGTDLANKLNPWVAAVLSFHRGSAAPSYVTTGMEWQKDVSGTVAERYVYDGAQSVLVYTINPTAHTIQIPAASLPAASDTVAGAVELSTNAEYLTGTAINRAVTPDSAAALWEAGADNAGGATITLGDGGSFNLITSTTAITAFAFTNDKAGRAARIRFNTARTLTHDATSLILPNAGSNISTAVGDTCEIESLGSGNFRVTRYTRADGTAVAATAASGIPTGAIIDFAGTSAPTGYLLCDGSAVSRTTYADLFTVTGTTYGAGNGSSTFNVPDLRGRVTAGQDDMGGTSANRLTGLSGGVNGDNLGASGGEETHTLITAEMPAHTHTYTAAGAGATVIGSGSNSATFAASTTGSTGGGGAHNNVQPTLILNKIIKT